MSCEWWPKRWDRGNKWTKWVSSIEHQGLRDTVSIKTAPSGLTEPADDPEQPEADNELSLFAVHCGVHFITVCSHYRKCFCWVVKEQEDGDCCCCCCFWSPLKSLDDDCWESNISSAERNICCILGLRRKKLKLLAPPWEVLFSPLAVLQPAGSVLIVQARGAAGLIR